MRAGASAEIIAAETGWPLDKVARYAEPPLAERAFIAERAQQVEMRRSGGRVRLADSVDLVLGPDHARAVRWDAYRRDDGRWIVTAELPASTGRPAGTWTYDPAGPNLHPLDEPARWLMGVSDEPLIDYITDEVDAVDAGEPARPHLIAVPALADETVEDETVEETVITAEPELAVDEPAPPAPAQPQQGEFPIEQPGGAKARKARPKGRRASVPSWDEILFGASRGDDA